MEHEQEQRVYREIAYLVQSGNVNSLKDYLEAEIDWMLNDLRLPENGTNVYLSKIDLVLNTEIP
jgi:hypothetical protein